MKLAHGAMRLEFQAGLRRACHDPRSILPKSRAEAQRSKSRMFVICGNLYHWQLPWQGAHAPQVWEVSRAQHSFSVNEFLTHVYIYLEKVGLSICSDEPVPPPSLWIHQPRGLNHSANGKVNIVGVDHGDRRISETSKGSMHSTLGEDGTVDPVV